MKDRALNKEGPSRDTHHLPLWLEVSFQLSSQVRENLDEVSCTWSFNSLAFFFLLVIS